MREKEDDENDEDEEEGKLEKGLESVSTAATSEGEEEEGGLEEREGDSAMTTSSTGSAGFWARDWALRAANFCRSSSRFCLASSCFSVSSAGAAAAGGAAEAAGLRAFLRSSSRCFRALSTSSIISLLRASSSTSGSMGVFLFPRELNALSSSIFVVSLCLCLWLWC